MDNLFGVPLNSIMVALLILMGGAFAVIGWIAIRHMLLVRMGLRNAIRRPTQTILIVVGLMLSTLIISAAFSTGDTVGHSVTNQIYTSLQGVDYLVGYDAEGKTVTRDEAYLTDDFLETFKQQFGNDPDIDGITPLLQDQLPVLNPGKRLSEPAAGFFGIDPATVDDFHGLRALDGKEVSASALTDGRAFISRDLAESIDAKAGDHVTVFVGNAPEDFEVAEVVQDTSVTAQSALGGGGTAGGIVVNLATAQRMLDREGRISNIGVSTTGGTRDALALDTDRVQTSIEDYLDANPQYNAKVLASKSDIVAVGELLGSFFVTFFLIFGLFSIAAGIMLIFLIFVMLAAERRSEMGMARAVGMSRLHLTETFLAEGMAYNIGSAAVGGLLGLGVSALLVYVLGQIAGDFGLTITFHFNPRAFIVSYSLGVVLTFITVTFAAYRAANLNIVRAIRDIDEPQMLTGANRSIGGLLQAAVGVLWYLAWLVLLTFLGIAAFGLFVVGLTTFGLGFVVAGALGALYWFGSRLVNRRNKHTGQWIVFGLWLFFLLPFSLPTLILLKTRGWANEHRNAGGWALWMLIFGVALTYMGGWQWHQAFAYTGGTTLAILAVAMLAVYFGSAPRPAFTVASFALVWYWLLPLPFSLFSDATMENFGPLEGITKVLGLPQPHASGDIEMFFVSGICITASATLLLVFNADAILAVVSLFGRYLGGIAPALKTAIAYPLAAKFRTGMTLAMFGLVVFSLVVMSTLNSNFSQLFAGQDARAGFDVTVDTNPSNRVPDLQAALRDANYDGAPLAGVGKQVDAAQRTEVRDDSAPNPDFRYLRVVGNDNTFFDLAKLRLSYRAAGYATDEAVMAALKSDPTLAIIDGSVVAAADGFGGDSEDIFKLANPETVKAGDFAPIPVTVRNPSGGPDLQLKIIGVMQAQVTGVITSLVGLHTNISNIDKSFAGGDHEQYFITLDGKPSKAESIEVANAIESSLLEQGVQATSVSKAIDDQAQASDAFSYLFQGFMGLGLIVGIAALGVISFRTVVERRQQIGMLRAIGYSRRLVALSFFFESSFIALAGVAMGLILGTALSYNLLTSPDFTDGTEINFAVPWVRILLICGVAYGASALMTLIPARAASKVAVAEALRYE